MSRYIYSLMLYSLGSIKISIYGFILVYTMRLYSSGLGSGKFPLVLYFSRFYFIIFNKFCRPVLSWFSIFSACSSQLNSAFPTATSFAIWLAANMIKTNSVPVCVGHVSVKSIKRILVYNHYQQIHHALFLLSAC